MPFLGRCPSSPSPQKKHILFSGCFHSMWHNYEKKYCNGNRIFFYYLFFFFYFLVLKSKNGSFLFQKRLFFHSFYYLLIKSITFIHYEQITHLKSWWNCYQVYCCDVIVFSVTAFRSAKTQKTKYLGIISKPWIISMLNVCFYYLQSILLSSQKKKPWTVEANLFLS